VPAAQLHSLDDGRPGWARDRSNVTSLLNFIGQRDKTRPFFGFMFFESPHARYYFPPESVIRKPYRDDINYASLSKGALEENIVPIKNRYINAVHHLDSQFGRVFDYLRQNGLLENTIVVLVGDHGEEFMEHGFWCHNSTFVEQQVRTPLVIWIPGQQPRVYDAMSSHMDIVPTLMPLLGVRNAEADYSEGFSLLNDLPRTYTYVSDWNRITYVDSEVKITQPLSIGGLATYRITAGSDKPLPIQQVADTLKRKQPALLRLVQDVGRFLDKKKR
jgi:membrane-anchored protein YejM (alkaline phosphatase superfamily)